ncbi:hypothetical protein [Alloalcanivorax gelatiniphagus]|uniref:DUF4175 domain-containing protein n=1 Tax=Alloalcanivorax gelatiniphagus TaxID=1194167 RepID=A0ABY2XIV0_9GAMM|nr:hypothetical protein [Alloalcanivorax gelatiniphagus]TMW11335.1 hypothetical protein FGS76_14855 [Alloalcanivorax gelatiniphagus]|tara:strand:- start:7167 stop:7421 length:255 start_codon:yes stop_codon:yes gene_type:complete
MRGLLGTLLGLPLAMMLCGLLAAAVPVDWRQWLVPLMLLSLLVWAALIVLAGLARTPWRLGAGLLVANGLAWLLLQTTSLYGGA